jgi:hypothetical protein
MMSKHRRPSVLPALAVPLLVAAAWAGPEVVATAGYTVQPSGPRGDEAGEKYFNVEGKDNGKYASFGLLTFPAPEGGSKAGRVESLSLTLVQSLPRFARDGKVEVFLVEAEKLDPKDLKFVADKADGLGDQLPKRHPLGAGAFKKVETGHADTFSLALDDASRKALAAAIDAGGKVHLLIVPDDPNVAATYFGAGAEKAKQRPRLAFTFASP